MHTKSILRSLTRSAFPVLLVSSFFIIFGNLANAADDNMQNIIVELKRVDGRSFPGEGLLNNAAQKARQRAAIRASQAQLENRMLSKGMQMANVRRFQTVPAIALRASQLTIDTLRSDPNVASVSRDLMLKPSLNSSTQVIGAPNAWSMGYEGSNWAVAVLDTGTDYNHPSFSGKLVAEACFSASFPQEGISSLCPAGTDVQFGAGAGINCSGISGCDHGTHVAGIAVAAAGTYPGVARGGNLVAIQVFSQQGNTLTAFASSLLFALEHVLMLSQTQQIAAVNMSLGGGLFADNCDDEVPPVTTAIANLRAAGIATAVASGNDGATRGISFPACITDAIAVGATHDNDSIPSFPNSSPLLDLLAPGTFITAPVFNSNFGQKSGTSMSTPHVAGAFAVLRSVDAQASVDLLLTTLKDTGVAVTDNRNGITRSRIQLDDAVTELLGGNTDPTDLSDNFNDGDFNGWTAVDDGNLSGPDNWGVTAGKLRQTANIYSQPTDRDSLAKNGTYLVYDSGYSFTDYQLDVDIRSEDDDAIGVMFRVQDNDNYYRFSWDQERGYRRLVKNVNGQFTLLAEDSVPYTSNQDYSLSITAQGAALQVSVDGQPILAASDSDLSSGSVAMYAWANTGAFFDNVVVTPSDGPFNTPPIIASTTATPPTINDTQTSQLSVLASDVDGDSLSYTWVVPAGQGNVSDSTITNPVFTPADVTNTQVVTIVVVVSDGTATTSSSVDITVTDANAGPIILDDDFNDGDHAGWTAVDEGDISAPGNWIVSGNELRQISNIYSSPTDRNSLAKLGTYLAYDSGYSFSDYQLFVDMRSTDNDTLGVMFRVQDSNNYYRFSWDQQRGYRRLVKNVDGQFTLLAEDSVPYQPNRNYSIAIRAVGPGLRLDIDGQTIFSVQDIAHATGSIAMYSWGNADSVFDNVLVRDESGQVNAPPVIQSVTATPATFTDNETSQLNVQATDVNGESLTYLWQAPAGSGNFNNPTIADPVFTPTDVALPTPLTLTVAVSDGTSTTNGSVVVTVTDGGGSEILLADNFDDGDYLGWSVVDEADISGPANWQVANGELVQLSNAFTQPADRDSLAKKGSYLVYDDGYGFSNYRAATTMRSGDNDALGIMFRVQDNDNYYRFSWDQQRSYRRLVKVINGQFTILAENNGSYQQNRNYQIEVVADGASLQVLVDGQTILSAIDTDITAGTIGMYVWGNTDSVFDNVVVTTE